MTGMGHLHPYAASSAIGCRAPIADLPALAPERGGSNLKQPFAVRVTSAARHHKPTKCWANHV
jgi:hypothetical protein